MLLSVKMWQEQVEAVEHSTAVFSHCHPARPSQSVLRVPSVFFVPMLQCVLRENKVFVCFVHCFTQEPAHSVCQGDT